jgi:hypothetical protein
VWQDDNFVKAMEKQKLKWGKLVVRTIMKIGYGITVQESDDPYISIAEEALNGAADAAIPAAFWIDLFPVLKYLPSWFRGAGFQKRAAHVREATNTMVERPFRYVQEQLACEVQLF